MSRILRGCLILFVASLLATSTSSRGWSQGLLVDVDVKTRFRLPRPPHLILPRPRAPESNNYKIEQILVQAHLQGQIAKVQVSQTFVNTSNRQIDAAFVFPLPYDGAIDQLTLLVDGKEYPAKMLSAVEARRRYEEIVRKNRDPALLEWIGTGMFQTSVFPIPPGAERTVTLRYNQLCRSSHGVTDFIFPLSTARYTSAPIDKLRVELSVESSVPLKNIYSPTHEVKIKRPDETHATVRFEAEHIIPGEDFRLLYDVGKEYLGASVISYQPQRSEDGYLLLLASPNLASTRSQAIAKTVVFVVDRSGSMSGKKIEQAKEALKFVLNNLGDRDLFNIVAYDSNIETFRSELQRYNKETRAAAIGFVEGLYAGGGTNIDGALTTALDQLKDNDRPSYMIFLTDGLPTVGEKNEAKIVSNSQRANQADVRLFPFGVGYDVNSRLLDRLANTNHGLSQYVRPNEQIEEHVSQLYRRIGAPMLTDVTVRFELDQDKLSPGSLINRTYPKQVVDLYAGEQLTLVGRYKHSGAAKVVIQGKINGETRSFNFPAQLAKSSHDTNYAFVEKLWAIRRVGEILDEIDLQGKNDELVQELVELAIRHGIVTPYTSFLADESTELSDTASVTRRASGRLEKLAESGGESGFLQRQLKQNLRRSRLAGSGGYGRAYGSGESGALSADAGPRLGVIGGDIADAKAEVNKVSTQIRTINQKTFYYRNDCWVEGGLTKEQVDEATVVKRFSREYFDLVDHLDRSAVVYLAQEGCLVVKLGKQVYSIEEE